MKNALSRRDFLAMTAAGGASLLAGCTTTAPIVRKLGPNAKLNHACIGVGGMMGGNDFDSFKSHPSLEIVAFCDVDSNFRAKAAAKVPGARQYTDWREMLAKESDKIDSVNVTVPDHMHAIIAMSAMRAGKHVYCQKPLAHDVAECRAMAQLAKKSGLVTQLGTQAASGLGDRLAVHFMRSGVLGKIKRVLLFSNRPGAVEAYRLVGPRPAQGSPVPESLNWELWTGTAPERPFVPHIYHPSIWRCWQDFGTGWSGDIGCHIFDCVWKGLQLTAPKSVVAEVQESWKNSPERRGDTWPQSNHITWIFPGSEITEGPELKIEWMDGGNVPEPDIVEQMSSGKIDVKSYEGSVVIGTEGMMMTPNGSGPILLPHSKFEKIERPQSKGPNHYHRFVNACLGGEMTESHFVQTGPMAEAIILGTVAIRVPGEKLEWDAKHLRVANSDAANKLLRRTYRKGWELDLKV